MTNDLDVLPAGQHELRSMAVHWIRTYVTLALLPVVIWFGMDRRRMAIDYEAEMKKVEVADRQLKVLDTELQYAQIHLTVCSADRERLEGRVVKLQNFRLLVQQSTVAEILKVRFDSSIY